MNSEETMCAGETKELPEGKRVAVEQMGIAVPPDHQEKVNHPKHYNSHPSGVECIDVVEHLSFNIGNAIKYLWRAGLKPDNSTIQDLEKAIWYLRREIERIRKFPDKTATFTADELRAYLSTSLLAAEQRAAEVAGAETDSGASKDADAAEKEFQEQQRQFQEWKRFRLKWEAEQRAANTPAASLRRKQKIPYGD